MRLNNNRKSFFESFQSNLNESTLNSSEAQAFIKKYNSIYGDLPVVKEDGTMYIDNIRLVGSGISKGIELKLYTDNRMAIYNEEWGLCYDGHNIYNVEEMSQYWFFDYFNNREDFHNKIEKAVKRLYKDVIQLKDSMNSKLSESAQGMANIIWGTDASINDMSNKEKENLEAMDEAIGNFEDSYNDGVITKTEFLRQVKLIASEFGLNDEEGNNLYNFYSGSYEGTSEGDEDDSFTMYNNDTDKSVRVWKQDGKWHDEEGNRYMGYLSKQDVKHYFKGNWSELKESEVLNEGGIYPVALDPEAKEAFTEKVIEILHATSSSNIDVDGLELIPSKGFAGAGRYWFRAQINIGKGGHHNIDFIYEALEKVKDQCPHLYKLSQATELEVNYYSTIDVMSDDDVENGLSFEYSDEDLEIAGCDLKTIEAEEAPVGDYLCGLIKSNMVRLIELLKEYEIKEDDEYNESAPLNETTNKGIEKLRKDHRERVNKAMSDAGVKEYRDLPDDVKSELDRADDEISCISMIHSILTYGSNRDIDTLIKDKYLKDYVDELGEEKVRELLAGEIEEYENATINRNVYTDSEGVTYNSVTFRDDE